MDQYELFRLAAPIAALPALIALVSSLTRSKARSSIYLQGLLFSSFAILVFSFCELSSSSDEAILTFSHFNYACFAFAPVFWFVFCYQYGTGLRAGLPKLFALLSIVPLATTLIAFNDANWKLLWVSSAIRRAGSLRVNVVEAYGPWFWVHFVYSYLLFIVGAVLVFVELVGHFELYRKQALLIIAATGLPLVFNAIYVFRAVPGLTKDFSALAIAVSGILFTIGMHRYSLLELNPLPRGRLDDYLDEGIVVVDSAGRILHRNAAAARVLGRLDSDVAVGRKFREALSLDLKALAASKASAVIVVESPALASVSAPGEPEARRVEISVKAVEDETGREERYCVVMRPIPPRFSPTDASGLASDLSALLSKRELEIAVCLARGEKLKDIGARFFISENTVKTHVRHIYRKTGTGTRRELAEFLGKSEHIPSE